MGKYKEIATLDFNENTSEQEFSTLLKLLKQTEGVVIQQGNEENQYKVYLDR